MENQNRFYPDFYPRYSYEPTRDRFSIIPSGEKGEGMISLVDFEPGDIVFRFMGLLSEEITLFTLQMGPGAHIHDPFVMGKVLHCCDPNMVCDMDTRIFTAVKPIRSGDYLTMDYETTEDQLYRSFNCGCGAENCRGFIAGKNYRNQKIQEVYDDVINL
jgi:tyrocidine synthetase-3